MTVNEHYDYLLGEVYSWTFGDFYKKQKEQELEFFRDGILPEGNTVAIDLGAGPGLQSVCLMKMGFHVYAMENNRHLLAELEERKKEERLDVIGDDIRHLKKYSKLKPELIVCCNDTITLLSNPKEIDHLVKDAFSVLADDGKLYVTFRDYATELEDTDRFVQVRSDKRRILTCWIEYLKEKIRVTDLLLERDSTGWEQKISSYFKVRLTRQQFEQIMRKNGFDIILNKDNAGIVTMIGRKSKKETD